MPTVRIREMKTRNVVKTVECQCSRESHSHEMMLMGMLRNMNQADYFVDDTDQEPEPEPETTHTPLTVMPVNDNIADRKLVETAQRVADAMGKKVAATFVYMRMADPSDSDDCRIGLIAEHLGPMEIGDIVIGLWAGLPTDARAALLDQMDQITEESEPLPDTSSGISDFVHNMLADEGLTPE